MRVVRGRGESLSADRQVTEDSVTRTAETGEMHLRVWVPHPHVAFGRLDATRDGYERARAIADEYGYPTVERDVGGRAVAYTGQTLSVVLAEPVRERRRGIGDRYDRMLGALEEALASLDVPVRRGEPDGAFCPGSHSLQADGKIAGLAQRVRADVAIVGGFLVVDDHHSIASVLDPVYDALDVPFDPTATGSVASAGGPSDTASVAVAIERAIGDGRSIDRETVRET